MRFPRMHGWPPHFPGSTVMRSSRFTVTTCAKTSAKATIANLLAEKFAVQSNAHFRARQSSIPFFLMNAEHKAASVGGLSPESRTPKASPAVTASFCLACRGRRHREIITWTIYGAGLLAAGKARARRISEWICNERATLPAAKRTSQNVQAIISRCLNGARITCFVNTHGHPEGQYGPLVSRLHLD